MATLTSAQLTAFFATALEKAPLPVLLVDQNGQLLCATQLAAKLFLMETREIVGQQWAGLDAQLTHFAWKKKWLELEENQSLTYDTDIITSGDYLRPVRVNALKIDASTVLISLEDQLEQGLKEKQLEYLGLHALTGYWFYNRIDQIWHISPRARVLLELDEDSNSRQELLDMLGERTITDDWAALQETISGVLQSPSEFAHFIRVKTSKGVSSLEITGQSIGNDLQVTHVIGTVQKANFESTSSDANPVFDRMASFSIEQSTDLIFWTKPDATFLYANQTATERLGYDRKTFLSLPIQTITPEFTEEARSLFWSRLREEHSFEQEFILQARDGTQFEILALISYLNIDGEEVACSFCRDISKRKVRESRQRLIEFSVDNSHELILWTRLDGLIHYANETFLNRTGFTREEVEGKSIDHFFLNSNPQRVKKLWPQLRQQQQIELEVPLLLKQGNYIPTQVELNYLVHENEEYDCVYIRDWTKKKERDTLVKLAREALDKTKDAIVWLEEDLTIRYLNQSILDLMNASPDTYLGKPYHAIFPGASRQSFRDGEVLDFNVATPKNWSNANGEATANHQIELKCTSIEHDGKNYFMLNGRDVTERLNRQKELETAISEIEVLKNRLEAENFNLKEDLNVNYNVNNIITVSPKYQKVLRQVGKVADVDTTVLITGETGTGKELLARAIHQLSDREDNPLIKVNCAALPENLIESELFGHEKGAFTGATARKKGRFEMADRGTIFLDEIGELPILLQSKLLRVLQEDEFERLGGTETVKVDVRLIAATNRNLEEMVSNGNFREDLYYRLNVFPIHNLPLRERPEDIQPLVEFFVNKYASTQGKKIKKIKSSDLKKLKKYAFPGNIRELENLIERAVVLSDSETLSISLGTKRKGKKGKKQAGFLTFKEMQRKYIIDALKATGGRISGAEGAGVLLNLNDRTLMSKMRKLDIQKRDYIE